MAEPTVIKDPMYSFEIARRAVGRAALHLGIDSMTEQTLDVMADVLLQYLARTGRALSHLAESSRRTSAHVNVLDAFQATQLVTSSAVGRLHLENEEEEEAMVDPTAPEGVTAEGAPANGASPVAGAPPNGTQAKSKPSPSASSTSWKGLATFVFGPNWLHEKDEEEYLMELAAAKNAENNSTEGELSTVAGGGKVFPAALENGDGDVADASDPSRRKRKGWDAPFPDQVPAFPKASSTCANPHALPPKVTGGLTSTASVYRKVDVDAEEADEDEQEALNELEALSDKVFLPETVEDSGLGASSWGSIDGKRKRTREESEQNSENAKDEDGDVEMQPSSAKKIKFQEGTKAEDGKAGKASSNPSEEEEEEFLYVPSFYPRPPSTKVVVDDRRTVVDGKNERQQRLLQQQRTQEQQEQQVFASGESLEGMSTTLRDASSRGIQSSLIRLGTNGYWGSGWDKASSANRLAVPMGRKIVAPSAPGGKIAPEDPIVPMSRASGSRVSRVLEGSMDAAAMQ